MALVENEKPRRKYFIESSCLFTNRDVADPFSRYSINSSDFLEEMTERSACPKCCKSRRYYCYNCYVPVDEIKEKIPYLKLPIKIDIIKHPREVDGKSTAAHAAVLAPNDVRIFVYPNFPNYEKEKVLLIFPGKNAKKLHCFYTPKEESHQKQVLQENSSTLNSSDRFSVQQFNQTCYKLRKVFPFEKVVFIDSTWKQTKRIYGEASVRALPCALLTSHKSLFWRHQRDKPPNYLSTIEAIYYFLVEHHSTLHPDVPYTGQYDNLLFFFKFMYNKIRTLYDPTTLKAYQD